MTTIIKNAHVISPGIDLCGASVEMDGKKIINVYPAGTDLPKADKTIDAGGKMLLPGFIDIHSHGAGGCDTCDADLSGLKVIAECKMKEGVTTWLPTTLTLAPKTLEDIQKTVAEYMKTQEYAKTPGVHLEGPYINARCCGAQNPAFVRTADIDEVKRLNDIARVLLISLAPETEGAIDFIAEASQMGIRCSAGHSAATHADFIKAKTAGLVHLTHFCNQMSPIHHREIGLVGSGLLDHEIKIEVICDQIHLCGDMLKTIFTTKCIGQMMMITDSLACSWMPDGPGDLGGLPIIVKGGVARLAESGNLAGSTLKYAYGLRNIHQLTGLPLSQLVKATSWNQAQSLGLTGLGKIAPGFIADMVLLNDDYSTSKVIIDGVEKYTA
ncbi:MAG: N-acetylglucosamine-6-phosphate deacetylase [Akkermansia sp.]